MGSCCSSGSGESSGKVDDYDPVLDKAARPTVPRDLAVFIEKIRTLDITNDRVRVRFPTRL